MSDTSKQKGVASQIIDAICGAIVLILGIGLGLLYIATEADEQLHYFTLSTGINPNITVYGLFFLLLFLAFYLHKIYKRNRGTSYGILASLLAIWSVCIFVGWASIGFGLKSNNNYKGEGYHFIDEVSGKLSSNQNDEKIFNLYVKRIEGRCHYYCSHPTDNKYSKYYHLVINIDSHRGKINTEKGAYVIDYDFNPIASD